MEFSVLGPLEVRVDGRELELGGAKPRGLLALLLLQGGKPLSADRIAVALWGEDAPPAAAKTVQVHVSRLRRALGATDVLVTTSAGYAIRAGEDELDAARFERLVADGRRALDAGDAGRAASTLREALALWRGPPLGGLDALPFAPAEVARLEEQRLAAIELRIDADLGKGRHAELVAELAGLVREHPWRERLHAQLMLALYRGGRQADALDAYRRAREVLVDELGIEPGPELTALQQEILEHDPGLARHEGGALPSPPNRTIGRGPELQEIAVRLRAVRLLTLTGPGGVGKTRLAIEAARAVAPEFSDGACWVALAALTRAEEVPMAIVRALGVVVLGGDLAEEAVTRNLAGKRLLLVLDNCEHLPGMALFAGRLVRKCPRLTVLATSREPLSLHAEERYPVPSLPGADAEALFVERARDDLDSDVDAPAVAEICRRLDGIPLALELAAARCSLLSPAEIARRLDAALSALGTGPRDAPERHRTLRATIDWSYELLTDEEKAFFAGFAVFAGGATVDAAEAVTGADLETLDRLVAKSLLIRRRQHSETRLAMLETIRAYALERFAELPDAPAIRERHFRYYLALAERHGSEPALKREGRKEHLRMLNADVDNLHAALTRALESEQAAEALTMCVALGGYWLMQDLFERAAESVERALRVPGADAHPRLRVLALCERHKALGPLGRRDLQTAGLEDAEATARALADPELLARALGARSAHHTMLNQLDAAAALADEAVRHAHATGDDWVISAAVDTQARVARNPDAFREDVEHAVHWLERVGNVYDLAGLLASTAYVALCHGRDEDARDYVERATPMARELDDRFMSMLLSGNSGVAALMTGDPKAADEAFREELRLERSLGVVSFATEGLEGLAAVAAQRGNLERAARLCGAAQALRYGLPSFPVEHRLETTVFEPARRRLGADAWDAAVRGGAAMGHDDAVRYALEVEPSP